MKVVLNPVATSMPMLLLHAIVKQGASQQESGAKSCSYFNAHAITIINSYKHRLLSSTGLAIRDGEQLQSSSWRVLNVDIT